jgi:ABC-type thiamine transport system substrate-binding protein
VDKTFKTQTARTIAADMLDIKLNHPQVDAGYFATVYLGQVFRRKPWEEFKRLNEEEFDEGKKEVYRNFGKLMKAMGAL